MVGDSQGGDEHKEGGREGGREGGEGERGGGGFKQREEGEKVG